MGIPAKPFKNLVVEFMKILAERFKARIYTSSEPVYSTFGKFYPFWLCGAVLTGEAMRMRLLKLRLVVGMGSFSGEIKEESFETTLFFWGEAASVLSCRYLGEGR